MTGLKIRLNNICKLLKIITVWVLLGLNMQSVQAAETVFHIDSQSGTAMRGFDPISYFLRGQGDVGSANYEYYWEGAVWRFESEGNLTAFRDSPLSYSPQFGGFDAIKMADNIRVGSDPRYSDLYENRLYLFHSPQNLQKWLSRKAKFVKAAQVNWLAMHAYGIGKNFVIQQLAQDEIIDFALPVANVEEEVDPLAMADAETPSPAAALAATYAASPDGHLNSSARLAAAGQQFKDKQK